MRRFRRHLEEMTGAKMSPASTVATTPKITVRTPSSTLPSS